MPKTSAAAKPKTKKKPKPKLKLKTRPPETRAATEVVVTVSYKLTEERLTDLLDSALNGYASAEWVKVIDMTEPPVKPKYLSDVPMAGGILRITAEEHTGKKTYVLDRWNMLNGANVFALKCPHAFAEFIADDYDSLVADEYLQCCVFGAVIFG